VKWGELAQLGAIFFKRHYHLGYYGGDTGYAISNDVQEEGEPCYCQLRTANTLNASVYTKNHVHYIARALRMPNHGVGGKLVFECRARILDTDACEFKVGLDIEAASYFSLYDHAAIRYDWDESIYWMCSSYNTAQELTITTVAVDTAWHVFRIEITDSDVKFYIDGTLVATHTTQIPDPGLGYYMNTVSVSLRTRTAAYKYARYDYVALWNEKV